MRQIYESYVDAKRRNHERTDKIDYETVAKSLKKMVPKLDRKHKGKRIDVDILLGIQLYRAAASTAPGQLSLGSRRVSAPPRTQQVSTIRPLLDLACDAPPVGL
jgi:hypothetical protein